MGIPVGEAHVARRSYVVPNGKTVQLLVGAQAPHPTPYGLPGDAKAPEFKRLGGGPLLTAMGLAKGVLPSEVKIARGIV